MKSFTLLITNLIATATLLLADGIPLNRKTGEVTVPHTIVSLTVEQIEETQTLGTFTLTPEQWREIRAKSPQCPKRFKNVVPVTWNDCTCGLEDGYVIVLSRDRVAVLHDRTSSVSVEMVLYGLFKSSNITLRVNERGEFHLDGRVIPFPILLKAFAAASENAKRDDGVRENHSHLWLNVELPAGAKPTEAVYESRLKQIADAADKAEIQHALFPITNDESDR
jgi:hypothetical protein